MKRLTNGSITELQERFCYYCSHPLINHTYMNGVCNCRQCKQIKNKNYSYKNKPPCNEFISYKESEYEIPQFKNLI